MTKSLLVGSTGFVGSNLMVQMQFDACVHSNNVESAYGLAPDLCVYAGVPSAMFYANQDPALDLKIMRQALVNIQRIQPKRLLLVSTVAVYNKTFAVDEDFEIDKTELKPYGENRLFLEQAVMKLVPDCTILRLPALYGLNLKKNFIYDMIHISPKLLTSQKFQALVSEDSFIQPYYRMDERGYYECLDMEAVRPYFERIGFTALHFTDSRSVYQFYNLSRLSSDMQIAMQNHWKVVNLVTEPISAREAYEYIFQKPFLNELSGTPFHYDIRSIHIASSYLLNKQQVLEDLAHFVLTQKSLIQNTCRGDI